MKRVLLLFAILTTLSCSKKSDPKVSLPNGARFGISDAEALAISGSGSNARVDQEIQTSLLKITDNGEYLEITYVDENGDEIPYNEGLAIILGEDYNQITVEEIFYPHPNYMLLKGEVPIWFASDNEEGFEYYKFPLCLINIQTGQIYDAAQMNFTEWYQEWSEQKLVPFQTDDLLNVYFKTALNNVGKLDVSNPEALLISNYLPTGQEANGRFLIDGLGNCAYFSNDMKIRKSSGGVELIQVEGGVFEGDNVWLGPEDQFYMVASFYDGSIQYSSIYSLNDELKPELEFTTSDPVEVIGIRSPFITYPMDDQVIFFYVDAGWSFNYETRQLTDMGFSISDGDVWETESSLYVVDGRKVQIISLSGFSFTTVRVPSEYEVYNVNITPGDQIRFNGLRLSDGAIVEAYIDLEGNVTVTNENLDVIVTSVYPIF